VPKPPVPAELDEFLKQPNPAVIGSVRPDGSPHTTATWYFWDRGRVVVNMDEGRKRLQYLRDDPRVSITILGKDDWYHHVTLVGRISLQPDPQMEDIDRISRHYIGEPYGQRDRGRVSGLIEVESWHSWAVYRPWAGSE
jgi:PPOX class probable F420-dependent enzyme